MKIGINCMQADPFSVGGLTTYTLGLLEGFANSGNGNRFQLYVAPENQNLFEKFRTRDNFNVVVIDDAFLTAKRHICRAALLSWSSDFYESTSNVLFKRMRELMDAGIGHPLYADGRAAMVQRPQASGSEHARYPAGASPGIL